MPLQISRPFELEGPYFTRKAGQASEWVKSYPLECVVLYFSSEFERIMIS